MPQRCQRLLHKRPQLQQLHQGVKKTGADQLADYKKSDLSAKPTIFFSILREAGLVYGCIKVAGIENFVAGQMAYVFSGAEFYDSIYPNGSDDYNYSYSDTCCHDTVCQQEMSMKFDAVFIPVLYSLALVVGLVGNGLVLAVLCHLRRSWSVTDTFILHLSVADTLLLVTLPFWAVEAAESWIFGSPLCKLVGAIFKINFFCGIFLLTCISLDRYLSIVHAVQMYSRRKSWQVQASCLFVWIFCLLLSIPDWIFLEAVMVPQERKTKCVHNYMSYNNSSKAWMLGCKLLYHILGFIIPSVVMVFCYTCILLTLHHGSQGFQKQRAIRVIIVLVVAFFICWTPYNITLMVDTLHSNDTVNSTCESGTVLNVFLTTTLTLGYVHSCLNPILYAFVGVKFRRHLLQMLKNLGCKLKKQMPTTSRKGSLWSESADTSYTSGF